MKITHYIRKKHLIIFHCSIIFPNIYPNDPAQIKIFHILFDIMLSSCFPMHDCITELTCNYHGNLVCFSLRIESKIRLWVL